MSEHEHAWKLVIHMDGCHHYSSVYSCECGASRHTSGERDVERDPYAYVWFLEETCERCAELAAGAEPKLSDEIVVPT